MRAIQQQLPDPRHAEINRIFVNAKPDAAWEAARHFDAASIPWVKLLFDIRTLPDTIRGIKHQQEDHRIGVDQITAGDTGFIILHETPGKEVVVGSIGQYWHLSIEFADVAPEDFTAFHRPGWGKIAWAISVEPYLNGSTISLELRITATDQESWEKFYRYYKLISVGSIPMRHSLMSHYEAQLGKMLRPNDDVRVLPGDELIPGCKYGITHHADIEAPVDVVWRYLMQLGCDRAGWYSIDLLDNGGKPSIDHTVEGWEHRAKGDKLSATPAHDSFFEVFDIKEHEYFIIGGDTQRLKSPFRMTWAFVLEPIGDDATHLVVRARMETTPAWKEWLLGEVLYPPLHGLMSSVQIKRIKKIAERDAKCRHEMHLVM